jgi:hypothetical protein
MVDEDIKQQKRKYGDQTAKSNIVINAPICTYQTLSNLNQYIQIGYRLKKYFFIKTRRLKIDTSFHDDTDILH